MMHLVELFQLAVLTTVVFCLSLFKLQFLDDLALLGIFNGTFSKSESTRPTSLAQNHALYAYRSAYRRRYNRQRTAQSPSEHSHYTVPRNYYVVDGCL